MSFLSCARKDAAPLLRIVQRSAAARAAAAAQAPPVVVIIAAHDLSMIR
jgi:hypothetical protein